LSLEHLRIHWLAFRALRARVKVMALTADGEPVVRAGSDRLVLRKGTRAFWTATECEACGSEMATADLEVHDCRGWRQAPDIPQPVILPDDSPTVPRAEDIPRSEDIGPGKATSPGSVTRVQRKYAQSVAHRMLGGRVSIVGRDRDGALVATMDQVTLTLPDGARHFRMAGPCAFCGSEVTARVTERDDLTSGVRRICPACMRSDFDGGKRGGVSHPADVSSSGDR